MAPADALAQEVTLTRSVPDPHAQLARFRLARMSTGMSAIAAGARDFRNQVDKVVTSQNEERAGTSIKPLAQSFSRAYLALSESLDAARSAGVMSGEALNAVDGIMAVLKREYSQGLQDLRDNVSRLDVVKDKRQDVGAFCATAVDKIDRLEQFWQTTYEHVPRMRMRT